LIDVVFFDNDCISSFLWVKAEHILISLFSGNMIIPQQAYDELSNPYTPHLKTRADIMINNGDASVQSLLTGSPEFSLYLKLTSKPDKGQRIIGRGEASVIALALKFGGIIASNNLSDVKSYAQEYNLEHITTGDIMIKAHDISLITEAEGNNLWSAMQAKKRKIGSASFTEYLMLYGNKEDEPMECDNEEAHQNCCNS